MTQFKRKMFYIILFLFIRSPFLFAYDYKRVVCLVPSVTEIIYSLEAQDHLVGVTIHDKIPRDDLKRIKFVGGFYFPIFPIIDALKPDLIFLSPIQSRAKKYFSKKYRIYEVKINSFDDLYKNILVIGKMFGKENKAKAIIKEIQSEIDLINKKVSLIPGDKRKRVMRFTGRSNSKTIFVPGDDSFQNKFIRLAGGIPPVIGKKGDFVPISLDEWKNFNPQVLYGCGEDIQIAKKFFSKSGWKDVDAIKNGQVFYFPCNLTCRLSVKSGLFVRWLSSVIYTKEYSTKRFIVNPEKICNIYPVKLPFLYIRSTKIIESSIFDTKNRTLLIQFKKPMEIISTLEGPKKILFIGNHSSPPPCWSIGHTLGLRGWRDHIYGVLGLDPDDTSLLITGADMRNLSIKTKKYKDLIVTALVTAGVKENAIRASKDVGRYEELGTINIILLTNRKMTKRAMARAIITATEAKTAALQDLDVRSVQMPRFQATGTGTDEIIIVQGTGLLIDNVGGHTRLGELIARAVYEGVKEAIEKQNNIFSNRSIFRRLMERKIELFSLLSCSCRESGKILLKLEELLLKSRYSGFLESAIAISDAYDRGLIKDLSSFNFKSNLIFYSCMVLACPC